MFAKLDLFLSGVSISSKKTGIPIKRLSSVTPIFKQEEPPPNDNNNDNTTYIITIHNNINYNNDDDNNDKNHRNEVLIFFIWPWAFLCGLRPRLIFAFGGVGGLAVGLAARNVVGNLIVSWWKLANV